MTADEAEAPQGSTASTENVGGENAHQTGCAVLNRHKMRTPIQCDTYEWRLRAGDLGQVDSVKRR
jgi:hypothetical protein